MFQAFCPQVKPGEAKTGDFASGERDLRYRLGPLDPRNELCFFRAIGFF
jgi:hypothetical protein